MNNLHDIFIRDQPIDQVSDTTTNKQFILHVCNVPLLKSIGSYLRTQLHKYYKVGNWFTKQKNEPHPSSQDLHRSVRSVSLVNMNSHV